MLYENEVKLEVPEEEKKKYMKNMIWRLPESSFHWDELNKKMVCPRSEHIPSTYTYIDKGGNMKTLRYSSSVFKDAKGDILYQPEFLAFSPKGEMYTDRLSWEVNYFLSKHPLNGSGENYLDTKRPKFTLKDNAKIAAEKARKQRTLNECSNAIWSERNGFDIDRLRDVAKELNMPANYETDDEVRAFLDEYVTKIDKNGNIIEKNAEHFLDLASSGKMKRIELIQEGVKKKVIKFNEEKNAWYFIDPKGGEVSMICGVPGGKTDIESLEEFLATDKKGKVIVELTNFVKNKK